MRTTRPGASQQDAGQCWCSLNEAWQGIAEPSVVGLAPTFLVASICSSSILEPGASLPGVLFSSSLFVLEACSNMQPVETLRRYFSPLILKTSLGIPSRHFSPQPCPSPWASESSHKHSDSASSHRPPSYPYPSHSPPSLPCSSPPHHRCPPRSSCSSRRWNCHQAHGARGRYSRL